MSEVFHKGELAVQKRAGVEKMASRVGRVVQSVMHPIAQNFLEHQPFVVAASTDRNGRVWASFLTGDSGFIRVLDKTSLKFEIKNIGDNIFLDNLKANPQVGILAIEFDTRLRMRLNGEIEFQNEYIIVHAREVFSNCQKYIQSRTWDKTESFDKTPGKSHRLKKLTTSQKDLIADADTFFIASRHQTRGADASHRGGNPGFIKVSDDSKIIFPDYSGNMMFQTLGNIREYPNSGLLFIDFEKGNTLQLSGKSKIIWDKEIYSQFPGAERAVEFKIEEIIDKSNAFPFTWDFQDYSPANPVGTPAPSQARN
jgi:predicted pyridoxine 5'-phosphate oxidase superfamily flavin-nucleotide-binding protein